MDQKLYKKLNDRREKGTLRSLSSFGGMIDFASNDYLGFSKNEFLESEESECGATGSRLISGNSQYIEFVEAELAEFFGSEAGLCFNSGYDANVGIFSSIPQRGDVVLYDEFIHASARDGIRLSMAKSYSFKHNNLKDLARLLEQHQSETVYIAAESVYSMHGDVCPLTEMLKLTEQFNAYLILDEAHSAGVFGDQGRGLAHALGVHSNCFIRLVTFGKAFGAHGSVVLSTADLREYLINFARSFIYTTALPMAAYDRMLKSVEMESADLLRLILQEKIGYFRNKMKDFALTSAPNSPIQFIQFDYLEQLRSVEKRLKEAGIFTKAIYAPTVPEGNEGLRVSMHVFNTEKEIDTLVRVMST